MMRFTRYIVSILLFIASSSAIAQDSLRVTSDTDSAQVQPKKKGFAFIVGTDYGKLATTAFKLDTKYEFNLGIVLFNKLRVTADYGHGELAPKNAIENGSYTSTGNYYRGGLDYVFEIAPKTNLALGLMYASSSFVDEGSIQIQSDVWPSLNEDFKRENFSSQWVEWVLTSEKAIFNRESGFLTHLYFGMKFRLRFIIERPRPEEFDIYAIPGYGRTFNDIVPAVNLFITYKIN